MKKGIIIGIVIIVCIVAGVGIYTHTDHYRAMASHYPENTTINGIDCSGLTASEAEKKLVNSWQGRTLTIREDGGTAAKVSLRATKYNIHSQLEDLLGSNFIEVLRHHSSDKARHLTASMNMTKDSSAAFQRNIKQRSFLDIPYKVKTKNAYVDMNSTAFKIVKEVQGDNVDKDKVAKKAVASVAKGDFSMRFKAADFVAKPKVTEDSESLKEEQAFDKKHYTQKIVYDEYNKKYTISPKDLAKMMPRRGNDTALDEKAVEKFVDKTLAWEINTQYATRKFKSTDQGTITVVGGNYGYAINKKKEIKALTKELKVGKDVERKPYYSQTPYYTGGGKNDIGDSYIEVSISSQTLWLYKNGKKLMSTAVTTGKSGHDTACGTFFIAYKQRNTTLRGQNDDGSDYNSDVSYWMPFNGGQGCHDASWRSDFGSSAYTTNGSHGCVNMQTGDAAFLYNHIKAGYPIVVHA